VRVYDAPPGRLNLKILSRFAPSLTPVCERCVLTYSHSFDYFLYGAATINFVQFLRQLGLQSFIMTLYLLHVSFLSLV
jgi:hypothetical protein